MANKRAPKPIQPQGTPQARQRQAKASLAPRAEADPLRVQFRATIGAFLHGLGWKQAALAERIGISPRTLTRLTVGEKAIDPLEVASRYLPLLRGLTTSARLPEQRAMLDETLRALDEALKAGAEPKARACALDDDTQAALEELDALLNAASEAVEIADDPEQEREVVDAFRRARQLAESRLRRGDHVSDRELRAVERLADCLLMFKVETREGELKGVAKILDNALGFLRRDRVWFDAEAPAWSPALCEAEVLVSRVRVALELAQPVARFGPELVASSRRVIDAHASVARAHAPALEAQWSRRLLQAHAMLLDARLEVGALDGSALDDALDGDALEEAAALRARTDALLETVRDETAGLLEAQFVAGEVAFVEAKLHLQAGDRAHALEAFRQAKSFYREAGYRGPVGSVQASLLALLHGACPECDDAHGAPALCAFCNDVYCTSCSPRLCPDCEAPIRPLRRRMWLAA